MSLDKNKPKQEEWEKCKRCGKPYPVKGVMVCPCHPMFDENYDFRAEYFEFKTPEDAQKCMTWVESLLHQARQEERDRVLGELLKEAEQVDEENSLKQGFVNGVVKPVAWPIVKLLWARINYHSPTQGKGEGVINSLTKKEEGE